MNMARTKIVYNFEQTLMAESFTTGNYYNGKLIKVIKKSY